jgi:hypothetical protein
MPVAAGDEVAASFFKPSLGQRGIMLMALEKR